MHHVITYASTNKQSLLACNQMARSMKFHECQICFKFHKVSQAHACTDNPMTTNNLRAKENNIMQVNACKAYLHVTLTADNNIG